LNAVYQQPDGSPALLQMGCYGLGISRIMGAVIESSKAALSKSNNSEQFLHWPLLLAPYSIVLIPPKVNIQTIFHFDAWLNILRIY
jgi:prolyl-tRNA synthetase